MKTETDKPQTTQETGSAAAKPAYAPPAVTTYTDAALLESLGPARAGGTYNLLGGP